MGFAPSTLTDQRYVMVTTLLDIVLRLVQLSFFFQVHTHKFGCGTSFAKSSYYATHYHHDNKRKPNKVMVLAKVYYGEVQHGNQFTTVPNEPCYTSMNEQGSVIVKYDDATAYPDYIIHYTGLHLDQPKGRNLFI